MIDEAAEQPKITAELCPASGYKIIHRTWRSAKRHCWFLRLKYGDREVEPYRCKDCAKWHVGHRLQRKDGFSAKKGGRT